MVFVVVDVVCVTICVCGPALLLFGILHVLIFSCVGQRFCSCGCCLCYSLRAWANICVVWDFVGVVFCVCGPAFLVVVAVACVALCVCGPALVLFGILFVLLFACVGQLFCVVGFCLFCVLNMRASVFVFLSFAGVVFCVWGQARS